VALSAYLGPPGIACGLILGSLASLVTLIGLLSSRIFSDIIGFFLDLLGLGSYRWVSVEISASILTLGFRLSSSCTTWPRSDSRLHRLTLISGSWLLMVVSQWFSSILGSLDFLVFSDQGWFLVFSVPPHRQHHSEFSDLVLTSPGLRR
jgi:hypothetical protein